MAPKTTFARKCRPLLPIFGSPPGPQNRPKIDPWPQKGRQEAIFYRIFSRKSFFSLLGLIFYRFLVKIWWKNRCVFSKLRAFFWTWRTPKTMHWRSVLSTFHFFSFSDNYWKITKKMKQNWYRKETSTNEAQGVPKLTQNSSELFKMCWNYQHWLQKIWNLRDRFLDDFLGGPNHRFTGSQGGPRGSGSTREAQVDTHDLAGSGGIWRDLERSGPRIRDNSFPAAPPCPQTPKPPNHQVNC